MHYRPHKINIHMLESIYFLTFLAHLSLSITGYATNNFWNFTINGWYSTFLKRNQRVKTLNGSLIRCKNCLLLEIVFTIFMVNDPQDSFVRKYSYIVLNKNSIWRYILFTKIALQRVCRICINTTIQNH